MHSTMEQAQIMSAIIDQFPLEESRSAWRHIPPSTASYKAALAQLQATSASQ